MISLSHVVLASDNKGKLDEFSAILGRAGIRMTPQGQLGVAPADEPYLTFVENALTKARHAAQHTGLPALADDSGLCVRALGDAPGVFSARYAEQAGGAKSDKANNSWLLQQLGDEPDRRASYVAVLVFLRSADDPRPVIIERSWEGSILTAPQGSYGFGYDPYFYLPDLGKTAAELPPHQKNQHSHRGKALRALLRQLTEDDLVAPCE